MSTFLFQFGLFQFGHFSVRPILSEFSPAGAWAGRPVEPCFPSGRNGSGPSPNCILDTGAPLIEQLRNCFPMPLRVFGQGALFGEASGAGPPQVLALHGWARRGADFRPSLEGFSFVAVDLPGFGATPPPDEVIGGAGYARVIESVLAEFPDPAVLVGHSFGGRVAVHLAAAQPERFKGLILTGVPLLRREATATSGMARSPVVFRAARWASRLGLVRPASMERLRRRYGSADYRAASGVMRGVLVKAVGESYEDQLASITIPVVLLWGAEDQEVPVAVAEGAAAILSAAGAEVRLIVEPGVGHLLPVVSPEALHRAVGEMIRR